MALVSYSNLPIFEKMSCIRKIPLMINSYFIFILFVFYLWFFEDNVDFNIFILSMLLFLFLLFYSYSICLFMVLNDSFNIYKCDL